MNLKKKLYRKILTLALLAALAIPFVPSISAAAADNEVQTYVLSEIVAEKTIGEVAVIDGNVFFDQDLDLNGATVVINGTVTGSGIIYIHGGNLTVNGDVINYQNINVSGGTMTVNGNFTQYNAVSFEENGVLNINGDFIQTKGIDLNGCTINVSGNYYHKDGSLDLNNGHITVNGDYRLQSVTYKSDDVVEYGTTYGTLKMNDANDYLHVRGNCYINSYWGDGQGNNDITNGTLELGGNFEQYGSGSSFNAKDNHKVIFSGTETQNIYFDNPNSSGFNILASTPNKKVNITQGRINKIGASSTVASFTQYGSLDINGKTFTVTGNLDQHGNINVNKGKLNVNAYYYQQDGLLDLNNGRVTVGKNYRLQAIGKDDKGKTVYSATYGTIKMDDPKDYFLVKGSMFVQSYWGDGSGNNNLIDGTLELKGSFYQYNGSGSNFNAKENHKVIFSGDKLQTVRFDSPESSGFNIISATPNTDVDIIAGRINTVGSDVEIKSFNQYGSMDVNGCTINIKEDLNQFGKIYVNAGKLTVAGNYTQQDGVLDFNNGCVEVTGDYRLQSKSTDENGETVYGSTYGTIKMYNADDYFLVKGNMFVQSYWGDGANNNNLVDGTLELKGNFTQISGSGSNFNAKENHKVIFSGDKLQTVNFDSPKDSGFNILSATPNTNVDITAGRINTIGSDVTIKNFCQYGSMDVNGKTLNITGTINQYGNVYINSGKIIVGGYYYQQDGVLDFNNGRLEVAKNYRLQTIGKDKNGKTVYGSTYGTIKMNDADDYFLVKGSMMVQSYWGDGENNNNLVDGTLELKGNFYQYNGSGSNFNAQENHKVIFSGNKVQTVRFDSPENSGFNIISATPNTDVNIVAGRINTVGSDVEVKNFNQYGSMDVNGYTINIKEDLNQFGKIYVNSGKLTVAGNYTQQNGLLDFNNGSVEVTGDYRLQSKGTDENGNTVYDSTYGYIRMNDADDYFLVKGNMFVQSYWGDGENNNHLVDGTLELKGNFTQINGSGSNFNAKENHKVIFSGDKLQTVNFDSPKDSGFNILSATPNTDVDISAGRITTIGSDVTIKNFCQYGRMDVNGKKLNITGTVNQYGDIYINSGKIIVDGYYYQQGGVLDFDNGRLEVGKNYRLQTVGKDENGKTVYSSTHGYIRMNDPKDYFLVKGTMFVQSYWGDGINNNHLVNGTLELKGSFYQYNGSGSNFNAQENHKVIFSGTGKQTVRFDSPENSGFNILQSTKNTYIDIKAARINKIGNNTTVYSFNQYGTLDVNGKTFKVRTNLDQFGNINVNGGTLNVVKNYTQQNGWLDINNGAVKVGGNYRLQSVGTDDNGNTVYGSCYGYLRMDDRNDYFSVDGNFYTKSYWGDGINNNHITDGILVIGGNFSQLNGSGSNFRASGEHITIFTGENPHSIYFASQSSFFNLVVVNDDTTFEKTWLSYHRIASSTNICNASRLSDDQIVIGETAKIDLKAYGGSNAYAYEIYCKAPGSDEYVMLRNYDVSDKFTFTPDVTGWYTFRIYTRDSNNTYADSRDLLLLVNPPVKNTSTVDSTKVHIEDALKINCSAEGGVGGYQYAVYVKKDGESSYKNVSDYSSDSAISIKFEETGKHYVRVYVKDSKGHKTYKTFTVNVHNELQNRSTISSESVEFGNYAIVNASGRGGTGPYKYSVYYKKKSATSWKTLQADSENASVSLEAIKAAGDYDISVKVTDAAGKYVKQRFDYTVQQPEELENTSSLSADSVTSGTKAVVNLSVKGGVAPYNYSVYYKLSSASGWTTLKTNITDDSVELPMTKAGTYDISVKLTDSQGKVVKSRFGYTIENA